MASDIAIHVENLSKRYLINHQRTGGGGLRHVLQDKLTAPFRWLGRGLGSASQPSTLNSQPSATEEFWALRDVSFDIKQGEVVGIVGRNGAGKSTLLKILSRITEPTNGRITIDGRVASLLEVGTGFHPDLTGRENIYLNGAIMGMSRAEIRRNFDKIVTFAEVEKFLDTPVKRYSSGMYVRLAFSVAAHLEPEILIVDEVLAVGDASFQKKCLGKMGDVAGEGRTVLLVSHNMAIVQKLCTRAILLKEGRLVDFGDARTVVGDYMADAGATTTSAVVDTSDHPNRLPRMKPILTSVSLLGEAGEPSLHFTQGEPLHLSLSYNAAALGISLAGAGFILETSEGLRVGAFNSYMASKPPHRIPSRGTLHFLIKQPLLAPGRYCLTVSLGSHQGALEDKLERILAFEIHPADIYDTGYLLTKEDGVVALVCDVSTSECDARP